MTAPVSWISDFMLILRLNGDRMKYFFLMFGACTFFNLNLLAQEEANSEPTAEAVAKSSSTLEELKIKVKPLTAGDLAEQAVIWQDRIKAKVTEIGDAELAAMNDGGDAEVINELREERTDLLDRQSIILDEWLRKGGTLEETDPFRKYSTAVSGRILSARDPSSSLRGIKGWLLSAEGGIHWGKQLCLFLVILLITRMVARMVERVVSRLMKTTDLSELLETFLINTSRNLVMVFGFMIALGAIGIDIGPMLAGLGVIGFVVGFALKDTLANFAAGFMILLYRPYDLGHGVEAGGVTGSVESMSLVSTTFKTPDNQQVVVPNGKIWGGVIINRSGNKTRRVDMVFGCGYGDDLQKVQTVLEEIIASEEAVLKNPESIVCVDELGDSSVNFVCRPWVKTEDYFTVRWSIIRKVKERFDAEGISIPYPTQDIHVIKDS